MTTIDVIKWMLDILHSTLFWFAALISVLKQERVREVNSFKLGAVIKDYVLGFDHRSV
jgi:hypothetical protein